MLFLSGGDYNPAGYKVGLVGLCMLVPLLLTMTGLGAGLSPAASLIGAAVGVLIGWGPAGRLALEAGEGDLLLASLTMLAMAGMLVRYHRKPGLISFLLVWLTSSLVWFAQPLMFPPALALILTCYLCVGPRHKTFTW